MATVATPPPRLRWASASPRRRRLPASRRWPSTVQASPTTAVSRPWPKPPAKRVCSSDLRERKLKNGKVHSPRPDGRQRRRPEGEDDRGQPRHQGRQGWSHAELRGSDRGRG